jgi:FkbM family methyltransferase
MDVILKAKANDFIEMLTGRRLSKKINYVDDSRFQLIRKYKIDTVIDVGANRGQWAKPLVKEFPTVSVHSFEPLEQVFISLESASREYPNWMVHNLGVGSKSQRSLMNVASNSGLSSSFLEPNNHSVVHPDILFEKSSAEIQIIALDDFDALGAKSLVKIDTGGYESSVLDGLETKLDLVSVIEIESSFTPMYEGETSHHKIIKRLEDAGFVPYSFGNVHRDVDGRVWQLDTILVKRDLLG